MIKKDKSIGTCIRSDVAALEFIIYTAWIFIKKFLNKKSSIWTKNIIEYKNLKEVNGIFPSWVQHTDSLENINDPSGTSRKKIPLYDYLQRSQDR